MDNRNIVVRILSCCGAVDTPAVRMIVRGWSTFTEEVVLDWVRDPRGISRDELLKTLAASLPAVLAPLAE